MGLLFSGLTKEDILDIQRKGCWFTSDEIKQLYQRFRELDKEEIGRVYSTRLLCIPEISINPIGERVVRQMCDEDGTLDFRGFLRVLAIFSKRSTNEEKLRFFIRVLSPSSPITLQGLEEIAAELYAGMHSQEESRQAVAEVFAQYDKQQKGYLEYDDLSAVDCSRMGIFEA